MIEQKNGTKNEEYWREWNLRRVCHDAGFADPDAAARALSMGSSELLSRALGKTVDAMIAERTKVEREEQEAVERETDQLEQITRAFNAAIADPNKPAEELPVDRQELEQIVRRHRQKEQELQLMLNPDSEEKLARIEQDAARGMGIIE